MTTQQDINDRRALFEDQYQSTMNASSSYGDRMAWLKGQWSGRGYRSPHIQTAWLWFSLGFSAKKEGENHD